MHPGGVCQLDSDVVSALSKGSWILRRSASWSRGPRPVQSIRSEERNLLRFGSQVACAPSRASSAHRLGARVGAPKGGGTGRGAVTRVMLVGEVGVRLGPFRSFPRALCRRSTMTGSDPPQTWLVSACLLGQACRYDGASKGHAGVAAAVASLERTGGRAVGVCPEELGGLGTPRPAAELRGGDGHAVLDERATVRTLVDGADVTQCFVGGAREALARAPDATHAVLKARSPSCGCGVAHRDGRPRHGDGVFAALLRRRGLQLRTEESVEPPVSEGAR